jgi:hypothetical protein
MRLIAFLLLAFGVFALAVPAFTFFTTERVVDAGFLQIDVNKPHTIVLNPAAGIAALVAGVVVLALSGGRKETV